MPEPLHPPYASTATFQPRQLNRWLDINSQNGPLGRIQTFVTLPSFSVNFTWLGYSDIVAAYNFEVTNNFSLRNNITIPTNPNYTLCVMWKDSLGNVHRYSLWRAVGNVIFPTIPVYEGQLIKKNFRFEIWSTPSIPVVNLTPINFYTSVLGILDYRYGVDSALGTTDGLVTNFSANRQAVSPLPNDINNGLTQYFISTQDFAGTIWSSESDITAISSAGAIQTTLVNGPDIFTVIKTTGAGLVGAIGGGATPVINYLCLLVYVDGSSGVLCKYNATAILSTTATGFQVGTDDVPYPLGINKTYFVIVDFTNGLLTIYYPYTQQATQTPITPSTSTPSNAMQILGPGSTVGVIEMFSYFNLQSIQPLIDYISTKYGGFALPLTFPANSTPQPN